MKISIITPCYNEEDSLLHFYEETNIILEGTGHDYEYIFVDDGSSDRSPQILAQLAITDSKVKSIILSRNFGKENALTCGIDECSGDVAIIMDSDLQHPPELIPELLSRHAAGHDMVIPINSKRTDQSYLTKNFSILFYKLIGKIGNINIPVSGSDFRLIDRKVINAIKQLPERNRFMKGIYAWPGFEVDTFNYECNPRKYGNSKFHFWKRWNFALDGIFAYSSVPLRIWTYIGFIVALISMAWGFKIGISALIYGINVVSGVTTVAVLVLFFNALMMISIGILGEYIGRIYEEVKRRPIYVIKETFKIQNK